MGEKATRAGQHRHHHRCALCLSRWPRRHARAPRVERRRHVRCDRRRAGAAWRLCLLSVHSRAPCVVRSLGAEVTLIVMRAGAPVRAISGVVSLRRSPSRRLLCRWLGVSAGDARARCGVWIGARAVRCAAVPQRRGGCYLGGDGGTAPTVALTAPGVGVASSRWAPRPMCRALPRGLACARSPAAACMPRGTAEAADLSAPSRCDVAAVAVVSAETQGVRS